MRSIDKYYVICYNVTTTFVKKALRKGKPGESRGRKVLGLRSKRQGFQAPRNGRLSIEKWVPGVTRNNQKT
jgi:hypothetical protein